VAEGRFDAVIFDMDGVLVDSGDVYGPHWRRWAEQRKVDLARVEAVHPGRPPEETIRLVAPHLDAAAEAVRFNAGLSSDESLVTAMPGALELVAHVPVGRWAVATSALGSIAARWLRHIGLPPPVALVSVDDVRRGKPAPEPYLLAAERLGTTAPRCLVVEDAPAGITAAKAAGALVVAVSTTHPAAALQEADAVIGSLQDMTIGADDEAGLRASWRSSASRDRAGG